MPMIHVKDRLRTMTKEPRPRHAALSIHHDGSGSIGIYYNQRERGTVSLRWADWLEIRNLINEAENQLERK